MLEFLEDIQLQQAQGISFTWRRTDKEESYIEHEDIGYAVAYIDDELDSMIKATGRIFYTQNSHRENVNMVEDLIMKSMDTLFSAGGKI